MAENMSISVNGQSQVPPGFRFHPTEDELLQYYLRKRVSNQKIDLDVIRDVDLNKLEPWDIQEMCKIGTTPQNDWYFFSHKDKKYPTGTRTNRATTVGFWKATGRDKVIQSNCRRIGLRKTLVFYKGRAPHGQKSDWIMHEYRLDDSCDDFNTMCNSVRQSTQEEGWVVCRIFKKKFHSKTLDRSAKESRGSFFFDSCDEGGLEQILQQKRSTSREEIDSSVEHGGSPIRPIDADMKNTLGYYRDRFFQLQNIKRADSESSQACYHPIILDGSEEYQVSTGIADQTMISRNNNTSDDISLVCQIDSTGSQVGQANWAELDNVFASHFNGGQVECCYEELACFSEPIHGTYSSMSGGQDHGRLELATVTSSSPSITTTSSQKASYMNTTVGCDGEIDLWSFEQSKA